MRIDNCGVYEVIVIVFGVFRMKVIEMVTINLIFNKVVF